MEARTPVEPRKPVLLVAAESIAIASGMGETVADVLRARALKHYSEALRQYLAIRLRSAVLADQALSDLRRALDTLSSDELAAPPGPRARLFKLARRCASDARVRASATGGQIPWLSPSERAPAGYASALTRVRRDIAPEDAELLELRYARELSPEELAYVVDRSVDDVITALERAAARAARVLGNSPPSRLGGLRGALQEAYALARPAAPSDSREARARGALPPGTLIGERYAVQHRVGEGSFGDVYRALDMDVPGHVVALKILHRAATSEEGRKTALRELRLIASVFHPSVVDFKDHGWYRDRLWFVMPWYEGETLEDRIKRGPLTRKEAKEIFVPLAQALATMHAAGIRHQDVKPDNVFLARIGDAGTSSERVLPVLIDLGVAAKEAEMIVAGTPLYFPPEIAAQYAERTERPLVTTKADVFSLALTLRNALEPSTQEQVPGTAVEAFISFRADTPPGAPTDPDLKFLEPYFKRWLARDASVRPTAQEFAEELNVLTSPEEKRERRRAVMQWALPMAFCAVAGISSITYVYLREREAATAARIRADMTQKSLGIVSAKSEELKESIAHSEMSRQELSNKLAAREQDVKRLAASVIEARRDADAAAARMLALAAEIDDAKRDLSNAARKAEAQATRITALEGELYSAQQRHALAESELRETRHRLSAADQELDTLRINARSMLTQLDRARAEVSHNKDKVEELSYALQTAQRDRSRVQTDLVSERRRTAELIQQVRDLSENRGAGAAPLMPADAAHN